jgi:hypothetical protein
MYRNPGGGGGRLRLVISVIPSQQGVRFPLPGGDSLTILSLHLDKDRKGARTRTSQPLYLVTNLLGGSGLAPGPPFAF